MNFGVLGSLGLWGSGVGGWGWGGWVDGDGGWLGGAPTHMHMHVHAQTHTHTCGKHDNFMQMAASIGFLGNPWEFPMMSYARACVHVGACAHACAHV